MNGKSPPKRVILWLRRNLRLHDNPAVALLRPYLQGESDVEIIPIYVIDKTQYGDTKYGVKRTSSKRYRFLCESLQAFRMSLEARGSGLLVVQCKPYEAVQKLYGKGNVVAVISLREPGTEELLQERQVQLAVESGGGEVAWAEPSLLHRLSDLPFSENLIDVPDVFTSFRKLLEKHGCSAADEVGSDRVPWQQLSADSKLALIRELSGVEFASWSDLPQLYKCRDSNNLFYNEPEWSKGGEDQGLRLLEEYCSLLGGIEHYKDTRNLFEGKDFASHLAPYISHGCLSVRRIFHRVSSYVNSSDLESAKESGRLFQFHLVIRDFFQIMCFKHKDGSSLSWQCDMDTISRWRQGRTGVPIVDAIAKELVSTGYISNRARQLAASALSLSLKQDWRYGASHFEAELLDYDVASNWVNWMIIAGGSPKRTAKFNIIRQAKLHDPEGSYVRRWIPELAFLPKDIIHEPWKYYSEEIVTKNLPPSSIYFRPIIPHL